MGRGFYTVRPQRGHFARPAPSNPNVLTPLATYSPGTTGATWGGTTEGERSKARRKANKCADCGKTFVTANSLRSHRRHCRKGT